MGHTPGSGWASCPFLIVKVLEPSLAVRCQKPSPGAEGNNTEAANKAGSETEETDDQLNDDSLVWAQDQGGGVGYHISSTACSGKSSEVFGGSMGHGDLNQGV